jgi:hypothetical protein
MGRIEELEAMAHRVAAMRRADRRKEAHGGYTAIIDRVVAQIYWLRTNEPKVIGWPRRSSASAGRPASRTEFPNEQNKVSG